MHPIQQMRCFINNIKHESLENKLLDEVNFVEIDHSELGDDAPLDLKGSRIVSIKWDQIYNFWIMMFPSQQSLQDFFKKENVGRSEVPALDRRFASFNPPPIHRNVSVMEILKRRMDWSFWTFRQITRPILDIRRKLKQKPKGFGQPKLPKPKGCLRCGAAKCNHSTYRDGHYSLKVCRHCHVAGDHWSAECAECPVSNKWSSSDECNSPNTDDEDSETRSERKAQKTPTPDTSFVEILPNSVTYDLPYPLCAMAFPPLPSHNTPGHRIAVGSFLQDLSNRVDIFQFYPESLSLTPVPFLSFDHPYPPTKLMFHPISTGLLASSSDSLRFWDLCDPTRNGPISVFPNDYPPSPYLALNSFDWNEFEHKRVGTSGIGCTIWDIEHSVREGYYYPNNAEVYDIAWGGPQTFASASDDGKIRITDMRQLDSGSSAVYTSPNYTPLLRLAWNKQNLNYMATTMLDRNIIVILDMRFPGVHVESVEMHNGRVNAIAWAPNHSRQICSGGVDAQAVIWELFENQPVSMYGLEKEVYQLQWGLGLPDWIGATSGNKMQLFKV